MFDTNNSSKWYCDWRWDRTRIAELPILISDHSAIRLIFNWTYPPICTMDDAHVY